MMVQAVWRPAASKMEVIPIFLPMIPFIYLRFIPQGCTRHPAKCKDSILVHHRPFPDFPFTEGSTGDKQTSKGLFICFLQNMNFFKSPCSTVLFIQRSFPAALYCG